MSQVSELTLTLIKLGFLAVLWLFVLTAVSVMRSESCLASESGSREIFSVSFVAIAAEALRRLWKRQAW